MILLGDSLKLMRKIESDTIDMIFADPPYFLSNNGKSIKSGKVVSVNKGEWDKKNYKDGTIIFTKDWLNQSYRLLKNTGTIWISGTYHNIFDVEKVLKGVGFKIINIVIWKKNKSTAIDI